MSLASPRFAIRRRTDVTFAGAFAAGALLSAPFASNAVAAPAARAAPPPVRVDSLDYNDRINANNVDMFVTNYGSFAWDIAMGSAGFIYPKGSAKTAIYAAGIWIGAQVKGATRVTVAEYGIEYTPGPMAGGTFQPDNPAFRNYVITRGDTMSADYLSWCCGAARAQGAPVDANGRPLLLGDQTMWSVYNDADPSKHTDIAGGTLPLGVQVEQTTYEYNSFGALGHTVLLDLRITNGGTDTLRQAYVGMWSDPDLGGAADDLAGCDTTRALGYVYNADNDDTVYGTAPPAVGFDVIFGPRGDGGRLGMTSFTRYINGTDPSSAFESYNYLSGLNADGSVLINPFTGQPTHYAVSGDPVTGTGWLDTNPRDRRMMLGMGPFTMNPGQVEDIRVAIIAAQASDRLSSITLLKQYDDQIQGDSVVTSSALPPDRAGSTMQRTRLLQAPRPNPARGLTSIRYTLPSAEHVRVTVHDLHGRLVATVTDAVQDAGRHAAAWRGRDGAGRAVASGVYSVRLRAGARSETERITLLR
jgi:hypothetical protein